MWSCLPIAKLAADGGSNLDEEMASERSQLRCLRLHPRRAQLPRRHLEAVHILRHAATLISRRRVRQWSHYRVAELARPQWSALLDALEDSEVERTIIEVSGKAHVIRFGHARMADWLSNAMISAMQRARQRGIFEAIPKTPKCALSVQDVDCGLVWSSSAKKRAARR